MEGIVNIKKTDADIKRCMEIVNEEIDVTLKEDVLQALTIEIMDTVLQIGGDFLDDNIQEIARQYQQLGGIDRFLRKYYKGE
jgi:hypothetical protein